MFEVNRENNFPTHTFLIYEDNNKYYWFEHSFEACKGIHEFNNYEEAIEYVKEKQFEFAIRNNNDMKLDYKNTLTCYEYKKPNKDLGVEEYLSFVTNSMNKIL